VIPREYKIGDEIEGQVVRYVPYGVFVKVYDDINGLIHLSELGVRGTNPHDVVKIGQMVKAKIILLDARGRKIGLSVKALKMDEKRKKEADMASKSSVSDDVTRKVEVGDKAVVVPKAVVNPKTTASPKPVVEKVPAVKAISEKKVSNAKVVSRKTIMSDGE